MNKARFLQVMHDEGFNLLWVLGYMAASVVEA